MSCAHCQTGPARVVSRHLAPLAFCDAECRDAYICATHRYRPHGPAHCLVPVGAPVAEALRRYPALLEDGKRSAAECLHTDGAHLVVPAVMARLIGAALQRVGPKRGAPEGGESDEDTASVSDTDTDTGGGEAKRTRADAPAALPAVSSSSAAASTSSLSSVPLALARAPSTDYNPAATAFMVSTILDAIVGHSDITTVVSLAQTNKVMLGLLTDSVALQQALARRYRKLAELSRLVEVYARKLRADGDDAGPQELVAFASAMDLAIVRHYASFGRLRPGLYELVMVGCANFNARLVETALGYRPLGALAPVLDLCTPFGPRLDSWPLIHAIVAQIGDTRLAPREGHATRARRALRIITMLNAWRNTRGQTHQVSLSFSNTPAGFGIPNVPVPFSTLPPTTQTALLDHCLLAGSRAVGELIRYLETTNDALARSITVHTDWEMAFALLGHSFHGMQVDIRHVLEQYTGDLNMLIEDLAFFQDPRAVDRASQRIDVATKLKNSLFDKVAFLLGGGNYTYSETLTILSAQLAKYIAVCRRRAFPSGIDFSDPQILRACLTAMIGLGIDPRAPHSRDTLLVELLRWRPAPGAPITALPLCNVALEAEATRLIVTHTEGACSYSPVVGYFVALIASYYDMALTTSTPPPSPEPVTLDEDRFYALGHPTHDIPEFYTHLHIRPTATGGAPVPLLVWLSANPNAFANFVAQVFHSIVIVLVAMVIMSPMGSLIQRHTLSIYEAIMAAYPVYLRTRSPGIKNYLIRGLIPAALRDHASTTPGHEQNVYILAMTYYTELVNNERQRLYGAAAPVAAYTQAERDLIMSVRPVLIDPLA